MERPSPDTVHVFDIWVDGKREKLHFDVMTTDEATALRLAKEYLVSIGEPDATITTEECQFCHSEPLVFFSAQQQREFRERGGFILPLPV